MKHKIYSKIKDRDGNTVKVQLSTEVSNRCCWIFCTNESRPSDLIRSTPCLTAAQARRVAFALLKFADGKE